MAKDCRLICGQQAVLDVIAVFRALEAAGFKLICTDCPTSPASARL
jgi:hypothetical protein